MLSEIEVEAWMNLEIELDILERYRKHRKSVVDEIKLTP